MARGPWMPLPPDGRARQAAEDLEREGAVELERVNGVPTAVRATDAEAFADRAAVVNEHASDEELALTRRRAEWVAGGFQGPDPDIERGAS